MTIAERLDALLRDLFNDDQLIVTDETTSADVPGWDSLAHVNLMFGVEQAFGVVFDDEELSEFTNVGELRRMLEQKLAEPPA